MDLDKALAEALNLPQDRCCNKSYSAQTDRILWACNKKKMLDSNLCEDCWAERQERYHGREQRVRVWLPQF